MSGNITPVRRVSVEQGDPGEMIYRTFLGAGKIVRIFLDDVEQMRCLTADADEGFVKVVRSKAEIGSGSWPVEIIRGAVRIQIDDAEVKEREGVE